MYGASAPYTQHVFLYIHRTTDNNCLTLCVDKRLHINRTSSGETVRMRTQNKNDVSRAHTRCKRKFRFEIPIGNDYVPFGLWDRLALTHAIVFARFLLKLKLWHVWKSTRKRTKQMLCERDSERKREREHTRVLFVLFTSSVKKRQNHNSNNQIVYHTQPYRHCVRRLDCRFSRRLSYIIHIFLYSQFK